MGQLRYTPTSPTDDGSDASHTASGHRRRVNTVALGDPVEMEDGTLVWDDARLPNGLLNEDGTITVDDDGLDV